MLPEHVLAGTGHMSLQNRAAFGTLNRIQSFKIARRVCYGKQADVTTSSAAGACKHNHWNARSHSGVDRNVTGQTVSMG
jgi:hypothetical protein